VGVTATLGRPSAPVRAMTALGAVSPGPESARVVTGGGLAAGPAVTAGFAAHGAAVGGTLVGGVHREFRSLARGDLALGTRQHRPNQAAMHGAFVSSGERLGARSRVRRLSGRRHSAGTRG
jgi:hypothetical protein